MLMEWEAEKQVIPASEQRTKEQNTAFGEIQISDQNNIFNVKIILYTL